MWWLLVDFKPPTEPACAKLIPKSLEIEAVNALGRGMGFVWKDESSLTADCVRYLFLSGTPAEHQTLAPETPVQIRQKMTRWSMSRFVFSFR